MKNTSIKRLELESWQKLVWDRGGQSTWGVLELNEIATGLCKIEPVYFKIGWYYKRKWTGVAESWFENGEEAYTSSGLAESFEYSLKILSHIPLSERTRDSLQELQREHLISKKQKYLLQTDKEWRDLREIRRSSFFTHNDLYEFLKGN